MELSWVFFWSFSAFKSFYPNVSDALETMYYEDQICTYIFIVLNTDMHLEKIPLEMIC